MAKESIMIRHWRIGALTMPGGALLALAAGPALGADLTVTSFGGAYQDAQRKVYFEPFKQETGIDLVEDVWNGGVGTIRAKVEGGGHEWDVVQVEADELVIGCEEGCTSRSTGRRSAARSSSSTPRSTTAASAPSSGRPCWRTTATRSPRTRRRAGPISGIPRSTPASVACVDIEVHARSGADGRRRSPDQVYEVLRTPEGVDRAFAKLDEIKDDIIWWEAGAQAPQLLASGEVVMTNAWNGRISAANRDDGRNFKIVWPGAFTRSTAG